MHMPNSLQINRRWFEEQLAARRQSQRILAAKLGLDQSAISLTFRGKRRMKFEEAAGLARLWGLPVSDVLRNAGVPLDDGKQTIPVGAWYDGHGEVHMLGVTGERMIPPEPMPKGSVAIHCRTTGSPLEHMDGWLLFAEPPVSENIPLDHFCQVKIKNGIATLGVIRRGYTKGRYNIIGPATMIADADIKWAAPVRAIKTP